MSIVLLGRFSGRHEASNGGKRGLLTAFQDRPSPNLMLFITRASWTLSRTLSCAKIEVKCVLSPFARSCEAWLQFQHYSRLNRPSPPPRALYLSNAVDLVQDWYEQAPFDAPFE